MTKASRIYLYIAKQPMLCVEWLISLALFLACIWTVTPWYHAVSQPGVSSAAAIKIAAGVFIAISLGWMIALLKRHNTISVKVRRSLTFLLFTFFMFTGILRAATPGPGRNSWSSTIIIALILGVAYIRLRWEQDG